MSLKIKRFSISLTRNWMKVFGTPRDEHFPESLSVCSVSSSPPPLTFTFHWSSSSSSCSSLPGCGNSESPWLLRCSFSRTLMRGNGKVTDVDFFSHVDQQLNLHFTNFGCALLLWKSVCSFKGERGERSTNVTLPVYLAEEIFWCAYNALRPAHWASEAWQQGAQ